MSSAHSDIDITKIDVNSSSSNESNSSQPMMIVNSSQEFKVKPEPIFIELKKKPPAFANGSNNDDEKKKPEAPKGNDKGNDATTANLATENWTGKYEFDLAISAGSDPKSNRNLCYSHKLKKMFVDSEKLFKILFSLKKPPSDYNKLRVRVTMVFTTPCSFFEPVLVCPNHRSKFATPNANSAEQKSVLLVKTINPGEIVYEEDPSSKRVSVLIALTQPQAGTNYVASYFKFACLGSCVGGINRRSTLMLFTLEEENLVVGRRSLAVRICSCPVRDLKQEEARAKGESPHKLKRRSTTEMSSPSMKPFLPLPKLIRSTSNGSMVISKQAVVKGGNVAATSSQPPPDSEAIVQSIDHERPFFLVPVFGYDNFKAVNKFSEFLDFQSGLLDSGRNELLLEYNES